MNEFSSSTSIKNNNKVKNWIYPMFFSTKSGPYRIKIVNSISMEPKNIRTIANETKMSYYHVKYNINLLEEEKFLIKINNKYVISEEFRENYHILNNITNQTVNWDR